MSSTPALDPLLHDLADRLRRENLTVHEGFGTADQRIDLAIEDPYHRGRVLIAVETDGPSYAALRSTRDRDRLRPEQLERLGWKHLRVWSTDLFRDPAKEIARILRVVRDDDLFTAREGQPRPVDGAAENSTQGASEGSGESGDATPGADEVPAADQGADIEPPSAEAQPAPKARRKRRRVFRKGTAAADETPSPGSTLDDTDAGWGEGAAEGSARDRWLEEQRPPHYE